MVQRSHIKWTTSLFIEEADRVHAGKYDYSKTIYTKISRPIEIICPKHGTFYQRPIKHLRGQGCPRCGKIKSKRVSLSQEEFEHRARLVHGNKYAYGKYTKWSTPMNIACPIHGLFKQSPGSHLSGRGCPECGKSTMGQRKWTAEKFKTKARETHSDKYSYDLSDFHSLQSYITILCPEHGKFRQMAKLHITKRNPQGCPKCGQLISIEKRRSPLNDIIGRARLIHGDKYDYSRIVYETMLRPVEIICPVHGSFFQRMCDHIYEECGCPKCTSFASKGESEVADWIESLGFSVVRNNRGLLNGRELDVYVPEKKIAVEYNGLYCHCSLFKDKLYHLDKLLLCQDLGIRLIQIWDVEWEKRRNACKDIISFSLGKIDKRIFARQCNIRNVSVQESNIFLDVNHIQGKCQANYRIGLFFEDILVGVQCYTENAIKKWTLTRTSFLSGYHVIGGISRMFKFFVKNKNPDEVIDYTDRRLFIASGHYQMGFIKKCETPPANSLTDGKNLFSRRHYRHWGNRHFKFKMPWDEALTDTENLANNGWYWIWDCGKIKNVWTRTTKSIP
jgi:ssDNA-binding Zn-finger/Zn-ribbon topoisomerase 1